MLLYHNGNAFSSLSQKRILFFPIAEKLLEFSALFGYNKGRMRRRAAFPPYVKKTG